MLLDCRLLVEHGTLWFLRHGSDPLDLTAHLDAYSPGIGRFCDHLPGDLFEDETRAIAVRRGELEAAGFPAKLARAGAGLDVLSGVPDGVRRAGRIGRA